VGTTLIPVTLTYYDETKSQNYSDTQSIGLTVSGKYEFIVALDTQDYLMSGQLGSINVKIANAGVQDAQFAIVRSIETDQFKQITPQTIYVGSLKSDDYDTEKFTMRVGSVQPGVYPFKIGMEYRDQYGNSYNQTFDTNVRIYSAAELPRTGTSSPLTTALIIVAIAVIAYLAYRKFFKKKSK
jgi:LPXTG-motif cell wall-anchored protein